MNLIPHRRAVPAARDPFGELLDIQKEMNNLFNFSLDRWTRDMGLLESEWTPSIDVHDSKDNILVRADVPGLKKEGLDISIEGDRLVIRGEKKSEKETHEKGGLVRSERFYGAFHRQIQLPNAVDETKAKANYKDGVLELVLPKKEEARPKQIKIDIQ